MLTSPNSILQAREVNAAYSEPGKKIYKSTQRRQQIRNYKNLAIQEQLVRYKPARAMALWHQGEKKISCL